MPRHHKKTGSKYIIQVGDAGLKFNKIEGSKIKGRIVYMLIGFILFVIGVVPMINKAFKSDIVCVQTDGLITIPWNEGWSIAISITPGIPIHLQGNNGATYDIFSDTKGLLLKKNGNIKSMKGSILGLKRGDMFYYNPVYDNQILDISKVGTTWLKIIQKNEEYTTGIVLVKVAPIKDKNDDGKEIMQFKAEIVTSLSFPKQKGKYQKVSNEFLEDIEAKLRK